MSDFKTKWVQFLNSRWVFVLLAGITAIALFPSVYGGFLSWDDNHLLVDNPLVRDLSWEGIKAMFSSWQNLHYKPLVFLSWAVEYSIFGYNPMVFHVNNILLHLLNTVLVFIILRRLVGNVQASFWIALLFGVHPMHVESVTWISERKDVLYTFFYMSSILSYLYHRESGKGKWFFLALLFFALSLLSKMMAVSLPFVLLLIDYYQRRQWSLMVVAEKSPFLLLTVLPIVFIDRMKELLFNIEDPFERFGLSFTLLERLLIANYELLFYTLKTIIPIKLAAIYPYPKGADEALPDSYLYYLGLSVLLAIVIFILRKNRSLIFGVLFFIVVVFPALQFLIPFYGAIAADRYSYVCSIGILLIAVLGIWKLIKEVRLGPVPLTTIFFAAVTIVFSTLSFQRTMVWQSDISLWSDVISKYPNVWISYNNRGIALEKAGHREAALNDFNSAITLNGNFADAYLNRALIFKNDKKYNDAIADLTEALRINPNYEEALNTRGWIYYKMTDFERSLADYDRAVDISGGSAEMLSNRATVLLNQKANLFAIREYDKAIAKDPSLVEAVINQGIAYYREGLEDNALDNFNKAVSMAPNNPDAFYNRGLLHYRMTSYHEAIKDFVKTVELQPRKAVAYLSLAEAYSAIDQYEVALRAAVTSRRLGYQGAGPTIRFLKEKTGLTLEDLESMVDTEQK